MRRWHDLLDLALRNLLRHPAKSLAVIIPLVVVLAMATTMASVREGFSRDAAAATAGLPEVTVQRMVGGRVERISVPLGDSLARIPGVTRVAPRVWGYVPLRAESGDEFTYTLMGLDFARMPVPEDISVTLESGRWLSPGIEHEAVIGRTFAAAQNVRPGDVIRLSDLLGNSDTFLITGIFGSPVQIYSADLLVTSIADARRFFGYLPAEATDFLVYAGRDPNDVAAEVVAIDSGLRVLTRAALNNLCQEAYGGRSGVFALFWLILLLTALLTTFAQAANIQIDLAREIGILKAMGWDSADVIALRLLESLALGILGTLGGILAGLIYVALDAPGIKSYFLGWSRVYPDFPLPAVLALDDLGLLLAIGILPLLAAGAVPAWLAATIPPDEAIRK